MCRGSFAMAVHTILVYHCNDPAHTKPEFRTPHAILDNVQLLSIRWRALGSSSPDVCILKLQKFGMTIGKITSSGLKDVIARSIGHSIVPMQHLC